jgi:hypothetical protein
MATYASSYTVSASLLIQIYYQAEWSSAALILVGDQRCRLIAPDSVITTLLDAMMQEKGIIVPLPSPEKLRVVAAHMLDERPVEFLRTFEYTRPALELCNKHSLKSLSDGIFFAMAIKNEAPILMTNDKIVTLYKANPALCDHIVHIREVITGL